MSMTLVSRNIRYM